MGALNFNLRNLSPQTMLLLKKEATKQSISVNTLILKIIDRGLGVVCPSKKVTFHDLDYLAGTWSDKEKKQFERNIKPFEDIDKELW